MKNVRYIPIFFLLIILINISLFSDYPAYQPFNIGKIRAQGSYLKFKKFVRSSDIKTIFEIGSRDALDSICLSDYFKCHVYAFECNPESINLCKSNIGSNPNITLIPLGVWNKTETRSFYRVIDKNIGASSFFEFNPEAPNYQDILKEGLVQQEITVKTIRLDEFLDANNINNIDLLCMDVQGAAYEVLESLGDKIFGVKYIIIELENFAIYKNEKLYDFVNQYLKNKGFKLHSRPLAKKSLFGDVLYKNIRY